MDRNTEPESAPISTRRRRSIVTMTETQLLSIDLSLMSTEMFPSVAENEKHSPGTTITEKEAGPSTENDQEKGKGPNNDIPVTPIPKYLSGAKLWIVITCVIVVAWLMFLDSSIIVPAIPAITDEFHSLQDIGWYGSACHVSNAAFQPLTGKIYRYFSSKWSFFVFLVLFEIGSLVCGATPSSLILIMGRVIAGIGSAGMMSGGLTIIAGSVPLEKRPALMGLVIGLANSGSVCGPVLGGVLTDYANWRWTFYINLPIGGVVLLFLAWCEIPDQVPKPSPMAVIAKLHTIVLRLCCGSRNFLAWNYRKGDDGLIPSSMAGKRPVWSAAATNFTFVGSAMIQIYLLPLYILPGIGKFGYYLPWAVAGTAATIIASGLFTSLTPTTSVAQWVGYQIITGGGRGIVLQLVRPACHMQRSLTASPTNRMTLSQALLFGRTYLRNRFQYYGIRPKFNPLVRYLRPCFSRLY
ncbi:efflux pump [Colletotrichum filicis]|nr:efflux pump [Colletotrichum filicis]